MIQPFKYKERGAINSLTGIKSSLAHLRSVVSLTYLLYLANNRKPSIVYSQSNDSQSISLRPEYALFIKDFLEDNDIESNIESNPLLTSQIESLYVGITLMFGLGKISFENESLGMTKERTGGMRFPKKIDFASNMIMLDTIIQGVANDEKRTFLKSWLKDIKLDTELELRVATFLNVNIENNLFKLRDGDKDIFFQTEGLYLALQKDEEVSLESDEKVGPARILNSMLREGLIPWLSLNNSSVKLNEDCKFDTISYAKMLSTSLDIRDIKVDAVEEIELGNNEKQKDFLSSSLQQIFYGAPGTGKSHRIKEYLKGKNVPAENIFRTTFHPDSDYSTFVGAYKPTMKKQYRYDGRVKAKYYEDDDLAGAKQDDVIVDKVIHYDFVPQTFVKAYVRAYQTDENVYLVIEEINRGNCAQIFGDLFQLLDRDENGVSDYTVKADDDLRVYLEDVLGKDNKGIKDGELCLPANLYIFATMNTSDQSLFPIDSAFKRRWDWEYEPIKYKNTDWVIEIGGNEYSWVSFQKEVNNRIFEATNSEDKMLGDYFVKPHNGIISEKLLLNKVLFYLWNDVCKDGDGDIFKTDENKDVKFSDLYGEDGTKVLLSMMDHLGVNPVSESDEEEWEDEEEKGDGIKKRYSINGEEKDENGKDWKKGTLVKRAVEIYCNNHRQDTAIQVRDAWMSLGFLIPHIVETDEDKRLRIVSSNDSRAEKRSKPIKLFNGELLHVSTQVGDGAQYKGFSDFLLKIQSKPEWGIDIQEL